MVIIEVVFKTMFYMISNPLVKFILPLYFIVIKISLVVKLCELFSILDEFAREVLIAMKN
jgi:hypothetical protein